VSRREPAVSSEMGDKPIYVTQPSMPPLEEFIPYLEQIWESRILTNGGPIHQQFERALCEYLGIGHIALLNNGTTALMIALKALDLRGEVITTPYSFVATSHALLWNNLTPVFIDINSADLNMDPGRIEEAITADTSAILAVHCYGNPCDVDAIHKIAKAHGLKVIYDAAHAFGVGYQGGSLLNHGDLSVLSFHATKVFTTFEGGAIVCHDVETKRKIDGLKNFGIADHYQSILSHGLNGKMSEVQAAFGLLQLKYVERAIARRREIDGHYRRLLRDVPGIRCLDHTKSGNYSYFPLLVEGEYPLSRDVLHEKLRSRNINARRYFYPLIPEFPMYSTLPSARPENLPVANAVAQKAICLPMYPSLELEDIEQITHLIKQG
jgi:dTDP-4-amino-4,6-dideoxygalactose transaminase